MLRRRSRPVRVIDASVRRLIADMLATMRRADGVGLAAVQIGVPLRVIVVDSGSRPVAYINPRLRRRWGAEIGPEGCLSVPGVLAAVRRAHGVVVEATTPPGRRVAVRAIGLRARILQHEIDHTNGILFLDRVRGTRATSSRRRGPRRRTAPRRAVRTARPRRLASRLQPVRA